VKIRNPTRVGLAIRVEVWVLAGAADGGWQSQVQDAGSRLGLESNRTAAADPRSRQRDFAVCGGCRV
jgi:hypothetical protein